MKYIINDSVDPWFNLALEEYFLRQKTREDLVCLWQNDNSVIIGRHQNTANEVNQEVADQEHVKIARRTTGGGAVYHDLGNLNYTFITNFNLDAPQNVNFKVFAQPVIEALASYGLQAELSGRNDILLDGKKISGTAQACIGNRFMFHGTLLYDLNSDMAQKVLSVSKEKVESKGVKSVKSRIGNIKPYLPEGTGILELKEKIASAFAKNEGFERYTLSEKDLYEIQKLRKEKYATKEWIFGESRIAGIHNKARYPGGELECTIELDHGSIKDIKFYGDFLGIYGTDEIEKILQNTLYEVSEVRQKIEQKKINLFFGDITTDNVLECMFMTD